ncbi:MAG TPA: hypothetical protein VJ749_04115 [Pyrinomonadaceae bacterium]|nr:hypothetical protein [Pyrinomonadaceae bacterium]
MSKETNNEIDLLLRRMVRPDNGSAHHVEAPDDRHLDADELSSYAQNALPAVARARYTEHLAECATCRRVVTELTLSLGAVAAPVATTHEPGGLKKFLASLVSPVVLRYAVPALGVIVVMVIGFVVLRQQRQHEFVAQLDNNKTQLPAAAPSATTAPAEGFTDQRKQEADKRENSNATPVETRRKTETAAGDASGGTSVAAPAPVTTDNGRLAETKPAASAPPPPAAATPAKGADTAATAQANTDAAKKQEEQPKEKAADEVKAPATASTRGLYTVDSAGRATQNAPKTEASPTAGFGGRTGALARVRPGAAKRAEDEKGDDDTTRAGAQDVNNETRTIAGRRFRKQGGIWTDTAYDSSTSTVNMARNSEQFRALVADEPAIGTIARQLDGEVIVVWKGRAYQIR